MSPLTCSRLDEVRTALAQGHWPQACAADLRAHVEACARCAQEVLLTTHLQQTRAATVALAQPASASLLWWRAQLRRRNAALERAGRPLAAAHIFALIIALVVIARTVAAHWQTIADHALTPAEQPLSTVLGQWGLAPLLAAVAVITTLSGVVLYLSTNRQ
ncbi:MAG TPA: hypothetical protein VGN01_17620 [Acidobacteriaceae bacterium]|jgi:hypothetical protein